MTDGYVALLDVLGFRELVRSDHTGERIRHYLESLSASTKHSGVKSVVFSDSIVLTAEGDGHKAFLDIAGACSRLMGDLLLKDIPLRGAIAFGNVFRSSLEESVFVAGRAIIDAYEYEQKQNWIGVMLAPSSVATIRDLSSRCAPAVCNPRPKAATLTPRIGWLTFVGPCPCIPFHVTPNGPEYFDGFAVVPTIGALDPTKLGDNHATLIERLTWLRSVAPSPEAQRKYEQTREWLKLLRGHRDYIQEVFRQPSHLPPAAPAQ